MGGDAAGGGNMFEDSALADNAESPVGGGWRLPWPGELPPGRRQPAGDAADRGGGADAGSIHGGGGSGHTRTPSPARLGAAFPGPMVASARSRRMSGSDEISPRSRSPQSRPTTPPDSPRRRFEPNEPAPGQSSSPRRLSLSATSLETITESDEEANVAPVRTTRTMSDGGAYGGPSTAPPSSTSGARSEKGSATAPAPYGIVVGSPRRPPLLRQSSLSHVTTANDAADPVGGSAAQNPASAGEAEDKTQGGLRARRTPSVVST